MTGFQNVLAAAQNLSESERLQLIDLLWDSVSPESELPLSEEWVREIERRLAELDAGTAKTVPWSQVRNEALARIGHGKTH